MAILCLFVQKFSIFGWEKTLLVAPAALTVMLFTGNNRWQRNTGPKFKCIVPAKNRKGTQAPLRSFKTGTVCHHGHLSIAGKNWAWLSVYVSALFNSRHTYCIPFCLLTMPFNVCVFNGLCCHLFTSLNCLPCLITVNFLV